MLSLMRSQLICLSGLVACLTVFTRACWSDTCAAAAAQNYLARALPESKPYAPSVSKVERVGFSRRVTLSPISSAGGEAIIELSTFGFNNLSFCRDLRAIECGNGVAGSSGRAQDTKEGAR